MWIYKNVSVQKFLDELDDLAAVGRHSTRHYDMGYRYPFCHDLAQSAPPADFSSLVLMGLAIQLEAVGPVTWFLFSQQGC